jgi:hypothetical protein
MVDLNSLVPPGSGAHLNAAFWTNARGEIIAGGIPTGCDSAESCGHTYVLIPCDEHHPGIDSCDYSLLAVPSALGVAQITHISSSPNRETNSSRAEIRTQFRFVMGNRSRRFRLLHEE